jgi:LysM repeat protein
MNRLNEQHDAPSSASRHGQLLLASRLLLALILLSSTLFVAAPAYAQERYHEVQRGESLALIAHQYDVDLHELMSLNGITNANLVYIGQRLVIPLSASTGVYGTPAAAEELPADAGYYVVQRGDTLSQVAERHNITMSDLMRLNDLTEASLIHVGQRLRVTARVDPTPVAQSETPQIAETIYIVQSGDSLAAIAREFDTTPQAILTANGLPNANFIWAGQRLRINPSAGADDVLVAGAPVDGRRWIEVNLTNQTLTAWQGDVAILHTSISSGTKYTPTVTGRFKIQRKYERQLMSGPGYSIPNVPWVMYFFSGYAIHGAYWRDKFGEPGSHGCVNVSVDDAEMLYHWAPPDTEVYVHE